MKQLRKTFSSFVLSLSLLLTCTQPLFADFATHEKIADAVQQGKMSPSDANWIANDLRMMQEADDDDLGSRIGLPTQILFSSLAITYVLSVIVRTFPRVFGFAPLEEIVIEK